MTLSNAPSKIPTLGKKNKKPSNLEKPISQINNCSRVHLQSTYRDRQTERDIGTGGNILAEETIA